MSNPKVSASVREGLNVESGLNDGICVPVLLMFLALLVEEQTQSPLSLAVELVVEELGIGAVIGIALTLIAWLLQRHSEKHHWQTPMWSQLTLPGLAILCFATAQALGGSGFIAAFVGGLFACYLFTEQKHHLLKASASQSYLGGYRCLYRFTQRAITWSECQSMGCSTGSS